MAQNMTLNVRVNGPLGAFVAGKVGADGLYENVSEYIRDLIRKDKDRTECELFDRLKAELSLAFGASDETYDILTAEDVITRNRNRTGA